jgi:hypothetical protein
VRNFKAKYRAFFVKNWPEGQEINEAKEAEEAMQRPKSGR